MKVSDKVFYCAVGCVYFFLLCMVARNLDFATLWYDEAGQLFISKGLNHWSEPYSPEGHLSDVIFSNAHYNQDPGGYSLILHFWSMVSSGHVWLRLLSFLFFAGAIVFTCLTTWKITENKRLSVVSGLLLFAISSSSIPYEVRGYAMELCGVAYGVWLIFLLKEKLSIRRVLAGSIVLTVFISSRYTMLMFGFVYACFIIADICLSAIPKREKSIYVAAFSLPLLVGVVLIYFLALRIQNPGIQPLGYFSYFTGYQLACAFGLVTGAILTVWKWHTPDSRRLVLVFSAVNLLFIFLGSAKILPWLFLGKKGAVFFWFLEVMCFVTIVVLLGRKGEKTVWGWVALSCCLMMIAGMNRFTQILHVQESWFKMDKHLVEMPDCPKGTIYVGAREAPQVRYLYEYGALKSRASEDGYPSRFVQFKQGFHTVGIRIPDYKKQTADILKNAAPGSLYTVSESAMDTIPPDFVKVRDRLYVKK